MRASDFLLLGPQASGIGQIGVLENSDLDDSSFPDCGSVLNALYVIRCSMGLAFI